MVFLSHQLDKPHFPGEKQYLGKALYKQSFLGHAALGLLLVQREVWPNFNYNACVIMPLFLFPFPSFSLSLFSSEGDTCILVLIKLELPSPLPWPQHCGFGQPCGEYAGGASLNCLLHHVNSLCFFFLVFITTILKIFFRKIICNINLFWKQQCIFKRHGKEMRELRAIRLTCSPGVCLCSLFALPENTVETLLPYRKIAEEGEEFEIPATQYPVRPKHIGQHIPIKPALARNYKNQRQSSTSYKVSWFLTYYRDQHGSSYCYRCQADTLRLRTYVDILI